MGFHRNLTGTIENTILITIMYFFMAVPGMYALGEYSECTKCSLRSTLCTVCNTTYNFHIHEQGVCVMWHM